MLRLLPPGHYSVQAKTLGYRPTSQEVGVRLGETVATNPSLGAQAVVFEGLTVRADRSVQVHTRQGGVAEFVSQEEIERLPTLGRNFSDFTALSGMVSPQDGVSTSGTVVIGGGRTSGVNVQIDGADPNYNFFGESRGGTNEFRGAAHSIARGN